MDPTVQASFIPKKSLYIAASREGSPFGLLFLIALLIFISSIAAAAASFVYTGYLNAQIASKSKSLALAEGAFDPGAIQDLVRIDSRLTQSKTLLANHVAVSGVFAFLAQQTLAQVSYKNFTFSLNADGSAVVTLDGTADTFATVALQSDQFGGNKLLKNVVFSDINVDPSGNGVSFSVSVNLDPSILSYANSLSEAAAPASTTAAPASSSATTTPQ